MDSTSVIDPIIGAISSLSLLFLVYAVWLLATGSPIWIYRARPTSTRPIVLQNNWFRVAGGIYIVGFLLGWILPYIPGLDIVIEIAAGIAYITGLWKSLAPKVL